VDAGLRNPYFNRFYCLGEENKREIRVCSPNPLKGDYVVRFSTKRLDLGVEPWKYTLVRYVA